MVLSAPSFYSTPNVLLMTGQIAAESTGIFIVAVDFTPAVLGLIGSMQTCRLAPHYYQSNSHLLGQANIAYDIVSQRRMVAGPEETTGFLRSITLLAMRRNGKSQVLDFKAKALCPEENFQILLLNSQGNKLGLCIQPPPGLQT